MMRTASGPIIPEPLYYNSIVVEFQQETDSPGVSPSKKFTKSLIKKVQRLVCKASLNS